MQQDRKILFSSILAYGLLALFGVYLRYFPVILSPTFTNIVIIGLIVALLALLVYQPFQISRPLDTYIMLPQYLLFAFLVRAATTLRLTFQPLDDPNYYAICTFNINQFGTLDPLYSWWYPLIQQQLSWPDLHILGSTLMQITGIFSVDVLRLSSPMYGILFFLGVFLLARQVSLKTPVAFLAALFASTADSVIFYQAEYHPQGLAFVYFVFLIVLIYKYLLSGSSATAILVLICLVALSCSHHFSSLFLGIFGLYMVAILWLPRKLFVQVFGFNPLSHLKANSLFWLLTSILMFFNHLFTYSAFLDVLKSSMNQTIAPMGQLITMGINVPLQATLINSTKYILLLLALISILYVFKTRDENELFSAIIMFGIVLSGIIGTFIAFVPVDRLIGFYIPFAAIFASLALYRFKENWFVRVRPSSKTVAVIAISLVILVAGPFNSMPPAILLHDLPKDPYYWHSNDFSAFSTLGVPGFWIKDHVDKTASFTAYNNTYAIPFFYGEIPLIDVYNGDSIRTDTEYYIASGDYVPNRAGDAFISSQLPYSDNSIYSMGRFRIGTLG